MNQMLHAICTWMAILLPSLLWAAAPINDDGRDTLRIQTNVGANIMIEATDKEALMELKALDINKILEDMEMVTDSVGNSKIVIKKSDDTYIREEEREISFDTPLEDHSDNAFRQRARKYNSSGEYLSDEDTEGDKQYGMKYDSDEGMEVYWGNKYKSSFKKSRRRSSGYFGMDLGVNNWLENGRSPSGNAPYNVRPWGSWYVSLGGGYLLMLSNHFGFDMGGDISWYNFKFQDDDVRLVKGEDRLIFDTADPSINSIKSKLTVPYVNVKLVPTFKIGPKHRGMTIGAGAYAGYRIGGYTKVKQKIDGSTHKPKNHSDFYLNNFRYGVRFQLGWEEVQFYANYDLNPIFQTDHAPELNAFSLGMTFQIF
ncbi:outer membrane beta-barrel protein [Persicobacter sp. CCB-QB2]|uniref:outer membrane beta-barrel protein n=1 Tax=Persicobacter sp. CCB-QB2 TaxID=1561025 RepID=UPI0009E3CBE8|nr:outer membrane beta-barrel protein [Persicobacter sp. CCB-QB2]